MFVFLSLFFGSVTVFASPIEGVWDLHDRKCSSGFTPRDSFQLGRDTHRIEIRGDRYQMSIRHGQCQIFSQGMVSTYRNTLRFSRRTVRSNCELPPTPAEVTYTWSLDEQQLTLNMGPFPSDGACAQGEVLLIDFVKTNGSRN